MTTTGSPDPAERTRPLRVDARRNRARLLEVARDTFATEGLAVPIDEIARRAGVGAGTVYRHFPTKESLFEAILLSDVEKLVAEARSLVDSDDPGGTFFAFCTRMVEDGATNRALTDALTGVNIDVEAAIATATGDLHRALAVLLVRAQEAGVVRDDVGAAELRGLLVGTCLAAERSAKDTAVVGRMVAVVCDGLRRSRS
ncbi:helix-turn-helix domain-containing protein [Actinosynnema sp. NPDC020468]|uniref:TetR/AcrR family transcriptional regulator n=1 Tax=Actinosynnema sp. NPDC020468 TaxID=3154488 RepID=UPI0033C164EA